MIEIIPILATAALTAATPGPNNFIVFDAARRHGLRRSIGMIATIVMLSSSMLLTSEALLQLIATPRVIFIATVLSSILMALLALQGWRRAGAIDDGASPARADLVALAAFQLVNPKGWILVVTLASAGSTIDLSHLTLLLILSVVTTICLLCWALAGLGLGRHVSSPLDRKRWDRLTAVLLGATAIALPLMELHQ